MSEQVEQAEQAEQAGEVEPVEQQPETVAEPQPETVVSAPDVQLADTAPVKVKKDRRVLRAVLRWTAAVVVFAAVGTSAAYGITRMERTDVPGLATESDGRWDYPEISKPPLPSGSPAPSAEENVAGAHYADLRALLLPAPKGAKADQALRGQDGWLRTKDFLAEYAVSDDREEIGQLLTDNGLRHVAARGWTTEDGTRTRIYLLQFNTAAVVDGIQEDFFGFDSPRYMVRGASEVHIDEGFPEKATIEDVQHYVYAEAKPYGATNERQAYLTAGDTLALIVQSRKGTARAVPFQQTVVLQSQLLS